MGFNSGFKGLMVRYSVKDITSVGEVQPLLLVESVLHQNKKQLIGRVSISQAIP